MAALREDTTAVVTLPFRASSVRVARGRLSSDLRDQGARGPMVEDAQLVVSELVANALRHASPLSDGRLSVCWRLVHGSVLVSVSDGGSLTRPRAQTPTATALGGRGLAIVETLSDRWWVEQGVHGTTVSAVIGVR